MVVIANIRYRSCTGLHLLDYIVQDKVMLSMRLFVACIDSWKYPNLCHCLFFFPPREWKLFYNASLEFRVYCMHYLIAFEFLLMYVNGFCFC